MFTVGRRDRSPRGQSRKTAVRCEGARKGSRGKGRLVPRSEAAEAVRSGSGAGGIHTEWEVLAASGLTYVQRGGG